MKKFVGPSGEIVTGYSAAGERVVDLYVKICENRKRIELKWICMLRLGKIKAAHPDDGWVDREKDSVQFVYAHFDDGVEVGDRIALGWPDKWRVVRVVEIKKTLLRSVSDIYFFEEGIG